MNKHPFDYSGDSIWTADSKLKMINISKQNGTKRREQIKQTEIPDYHPYQAKKNQK
tara:strand:+ start:1379 stop:1546 length:168 start_codon:yes stop_codon:yes gene_type:complete